MKDQFRPLVYVFLVFLLVLASCQAGDHEGRPYRVSAVGEPKWSDGGGAPSLQVGDAGRKMLDEFVVTDQLPSQQITAFAEDSRGYIWIGTSRGMCRFNGQSYYQYYVEDDSLKTENICVNQFLADRQGNLWIGTTDGLYLHRYGEGVVKLSHHFVGSICDISEDYMVFGDVTDVWRLNKHTLEIEQLSKFNTLDFSNRVISDKYGRAWAFGSDSTKCVDIHTGRIESGLKNDGKFLWAVILGMDIYVSTANGLYMIDTSLREWTYNERLQAFNDLFSKDHVDKMFIVNESSLLFRTKSRKTYSFNTRHGQILSSDDKRFPFEQFSDNLQTVFVDSWKNIWLATERDGYKIISSRSTAFNRNQALALFFKDRAITSLNTDRHGNLWIVAENREVFRWSRGSDIVKVYTHDSGDIRRVMIDRKDNVYIACRDNLMCGQIDGNSLRLTDNWQLGALSIVADDQSNVFLSTFSGILYKKRHDSKEFETIMGDTLDVKVLKAINLHDGRIAMLEYGKGVYVTGKYLGLGDLDVHQFSGANLKQSLFRDICEDVWGRIWVATQGKGVVCIDVSKGTAKNYDDNEYIHNVCSILSDEEGQMWLGTTKGLACLDPESGVITSFYDDASIMDVEFATQGAVRMTDNLMVFSNMKGLTSFHAKDLPRDGVNNLQLEYLSVNREIKQDLSLDSEVHLPYDNFSVDISYTTFQYGIMPPIYQYKMEGFDPEWNYISKSEHAYYSHLPAGKYVFRVKVSGAGGRDTEKTLRVIVHPPIWLSPVMKWFVYPLAGVLFILAIVYALHRRIQNKRRIEAIMREKEEEQRINEMNMRFFSNISHEFRTPLTLINGALSLMSHGNLERMSGIMRSNSNRMIRMVGQLMDFNKMENGMLRLSVSKVNASKMLREIVGMFEASMKNHGIECRLELPSDEVTAWLDTDKFEKIMVNLISNAIKYSGDGSTITVRLATVESDMMQVDVADTGVGVPEDKREEIFVRFYQLKQSGQMPAIGTGIGLYYTRSLVELHHGWIRCLGNEPHGSVFRFVVPMNESEYENDEIKEVGTTAAVVGQVHDLPLQGVSAVEEPRWSVGGGAPSLQVDVSVMLVDDDAEVMEFLRLLLQPYYQIKCYSDARTAYKEIEEVKPDLILSDVMMAEMDGYQFCRMIKDNRAICHVPVVLLTAKTAIEEQIYGLNCGASAYVTKPFEPEYLLSMIRTQLENVKRVQQALSDNTKVSPREEKVLQDADKKFMDELYAYFEEHLSDAELLMEEMTQKFGMSRTKFYYKTKSLTGETPNAFFKAYKLNRAAEMILEGKEKITYIGQVTGFNSSSHFALNFKKRFGCLPSEYKK